MERKWTERMIIVILVLCLVGVVASCSSPTPLPTLVPKATELPRSTPLPTSTPLTDPSAMLGSRCAVCHNLERVMSSKKNRDQWSQTVNRIVPILNLAEQTLLVDYLAKTYGP
jgi:hypothetical protein